MKRWVVNADDLGLHPEIDAGILKAHREGILTSATVLVTGRNAQVAVAQAKAQGLSLGVHLCLTQNLRPVLPVNQVSSLAPKGVFRENWVQVVKAWAFGQLDQTEIAQELRAQIVRAQEWGAEIDHLDSHQHLHLLPGIREVVSALSHEFRLPVRWPKEWPLWTSGFGSIVKTLLLQGLAASSLSRPWKTLPMQGLAYSGRMGELQLLEMIDELGEGASELMVHPGQAPKVVEEDPTWRYEWEAELAALLSPQVKARVQERGIQLSSYREIFEP